MKYWTIILALLINCTPLISQLENGLVSRYYFNDGTAKDNHGPNDGINVDALPVPDRFDNPRSAMSFDGNGYIELGDEPFRMGFDDFSISLWMKLSEFTFRGYPMVKRTTDTDMNKPISWGLKFGENGNDLEVQVAYDDLTQDDYALAVIPDLEWHHYVIVYERTDKLRLYIDNLLVDEVDIKPSFFKTMDVVGASLFLGRDQEETEYFVGTLDDIRIYRRVLRTGDVDLLFKEAYIPVGTSNLENLDVGSYLFPNPAADVVNFTNPIAEEVTYTVSDPLHKTIRAGNIPGKGSVTLDLSHWPAGLYTLRLKDQKGGTTSTRLIVGKN